MSKELNLNELQKVKNWNDVIIIVTRECINWENKENIRVSYNARDYSISVHRWNDEAIFGFEESEKKVLTLNPNLTYCAIKELLKKLKVCLTNTQNIYLVIHAEELGIEGQGLPENKVKLDGVKLNLSQAPIQKRFAILEPNGSATGEGDFDKYLIHISRETGIGKKHWELWEFIHDDNSPINNCLKEKENIYNCLLTSGLKKNIIKLISSLKHRLAHLFSPLDTDLQGLWDEAQKSGRGSFEPNYWNEVVEAYKDVDWYKRFEKAKELTDDFLKETIQSSLEKEKELNVLLKYCKKCSNIPEFIEIKWDPLQILLTNLKEINSKEVYRFIRDKEGKNPIHEWLEELDEKLDKIIAKIEKT